MSAGNIIEAIAVQRVIPVLRSPTVADAIDTARACREGGLSIVELTTTIPDVEEAIAVLAHEDGLTVGLGTITDPGQVAPAVRAGAAFAVSFCSLAGFVAAAHEAGVPAIPGALTPTEVQACRCDGADAVKIYPARQVSPGYLRDLIAVMPGLRLMPTGGLLPTVESLAPWLQAEVWALGIGGALGTVALDGAPEVRRRVAAAVGACRATVRPAGRPLL